MPARLAPGHRVGGTGCERSRIRHDKLLPQGPASRNLWRRPYCSIHKDNLCHVRRCSWDPLLENGHPVVCRRSYEGVARHAGTGRNSTDGGGFSALVFMRYERNSLTTEVSWRERPWHQSWYWLLRLQWGILLQPVRESPVLRLFHRPGMRSCKRTKRTPCPMK